MITLEKLKALAEKTTPGPWGYVCGECDNCHGWGAVVISCDKEVWATERDQELMAASRTAVPALIEEVRILREALQTIHNQREKTCWRLDQCTCIVDIATLAVVQSKERMP